MGGVIVGAIADALQRATGKPLLWVTSQFVAAGRLGDEITIKLDLPENSRRIVQAGAILESGGRVINVARAALGGRTGPSLQFAKMPNVKAAKDCPVKPIDLGNLPNNLVDQFERRLAFEDPDAGVEHLWFKSVADHPVDAGQLAIIADFLLGAHPVTHRGTSLDNTFRLHNIVPTRWVLNETKISGTSDGVAHGSLNMFAEDGTLLATASQTGLLPRN